MFRCNIMSLEHAVRDPRAQIAGGIILVDMAGLRFAHAKYLSPHLAKRSAEVIQDSFPMRFKAFHILHEPFYFDAILALIKPFMTEKMRKRVNDLIPNRLIFNIFNSHIQTHTLLSFQFLKIHTHGNDLKSLHKHIPVDILPREYGGLQGPFDNTKWREQILGDEQYFIRLETYNSSHNINQINLK